VTSGKHRDQNQLAQQHMIQHIPPPCHTEISTTSLPGRSW